MTKRVAWFTGEATRGSVTPHKVYEVFNEDGDSFNLKDDNGGTRLCLKEQCAHICYGDWVFADIVEEEAVKREGIIKGKQKKWSAWIPNETGECPKGLCSEQKVKLKWSDGDKFVIDTPQEAAWQIDKGDGVVNITHYKIKQKKWTKNTGVMPVGGNVKVEVKWRDGTKEQTLARGFSWPLDDAFYDIVKWRLAE